MAGVALLSVSSGCSGESDGGTAGGGQGATSTPTGVGAEGGQGLGGSGGFAGAPAGGAGGTAGAAGGPPRLGCIAGSFDPYRGNFHAHTSYSDGADEPADAFAHARNVAGLDIQIVTDHLEQLYLVPPLDRFGSCRAQADAAYVPGTFLADCGFEYGSGMELPLCVSTGHANVFFAGGLFPAVQTNFYDFYNTLTACTECIGQFNHPGDSSCQTWHDFDYVAAVDARMNLFEFNGDGEVWELFFLALDQGWHVSPMFNQDNHSANWGTANDHRSGVYLDALTRESLRTALLERRTFASEDLDAAVRLMGDGTCWQGSILTGYPALAVAAHAEDSGDGFASLELYGPGQSLLASFDCSDALSCDGTLDLTVTAPTYVVARAVQSDGDELVAAPLWVAP